MSVSVDELTQARDVVNAIMDELQLDAYIFEVEPRNETWEVIIECAVIEGWERIKLSASREQLLGESEDVVISQSLLSNWREQLSACKRKKQNPGV